jgi:predicted ATPase
VIRRLYVHNFRCLENFDLPIAGLSSVLLIGQNGSGKTAIARALEILQRIARGTNRVGDLVGAEDFTRGRSDVPMRFEIEVELEAQVHKFAVAFELPTGRKELRVLEEKLEVGGKAIYTREAAEVNLDMLQYANTGRSLAPSRFNIDLHLVALPIIQEDSRLTQWLKRMLILRPVPSLIRGDSDRETLEPNPEVSNLGAWFSGLLSDAPSAYAKIDEYLKQVMPDFKDIKNPLVGKDARSLVVQFSNEQGSLGVSFEDLSDGEKCFIICALVLAAHDAYGPGLCFWDEPDNYLALPEVAHFVMALRKAFQSGGQLIATSHNPEAIRSFSDENTLRLRRNNHLDPTNVRSLSELGVRGDLVGAIVRGDV